MKPVSSARPTLGAVLLVYSLAMAAADLLEVSAFYAPRGIGPLQVMQGVATGLLGASARTGGLPAAALGLVLEVVICLGIVAVCIAASRWIPELTRRPLSYGVAYGVVVHAVMTQIVVPLSAAPGDARSLAGQINCLLANMLIIGPLAVLAARAAPAAVPRVRRGRVPAPAS